MIEPIPNPYEILGLENNINFTKQELRAAYKKLAQTIHPDKGGSQAEFTELQWAYFTLSDPDKRAHWDRYGEDKPNTPSVDDMATAEILGAFQQWVKMVMAGQKSLNTDCIGEIAGAMRGALQQGIQQVRQAEEHLRKLEKMLGKFSVDDNQANVFEGHLNSTKQQVEEKLKSMKDRQRVLEKAADKIQHFTYSPEGGLVNQAAQVYTTTGGTTNAWG